MRVLLLLLISVATVSAQPFSLRDQSLIARSSPLLRGLIAYWSLEESSGIRYDASKNGYHLYSSNATASATGKQGSCASFTASASQYLIAGSSSVLNFSKTNPWSLAMWINATNNSDYQRVLGNYDVTGSKGWAIYIDKDSSYSAKLLMLSSGGNELSIKTSRGVTNTGWLHLVYTYDGTETVAGLKIYTNGILDSGAVAAKPGSMAEIITTKTFQLSGCDKDPSYTLNAKMDEVGIWNRVLSTNEITGIYASGTGTKFPRFK